MGLRKQKITRGPRKGEVEYADPPTLDLASARGRKRAQDSVQQGYSFYVAPDLFSTGGMVWKRPGPRSPYRDCVGKVTDVWPEVFGKGKG